MKLLLLLGLIVSTVTAARHPIESTITKSSDPDKSDQNYETSNRNLIKDHQRLSKEVTEQIANSRRLETKKRAKSKTSSV